MPDPFFHDRRIASMALVFFAFFGIAVGEARESTRYSVRENENGRQPADPIASNRVRTKSASAKIDALIDAKLTQQKLSRNPISSDVVFVRRIYLDVIGRIPTIHEVHDFLSSQDEQKRETLIDDLLDSYGYVSHQFNFFADLLRIKSKHRNILGQPFIDFVKDSLESNKAYDVLAREMLQSQGPMLERGNGATGYFLRDLGMPEDNMSNTLRVFLGTRLECAQCHDHPTDRWTQREYFEMLAFTGGMKLKISNGSELNQQINRIAKENEVTIDRQTRAFMRRTLLPLTYGVEGSGTGLAILPEGFLGDDGQEGEIVKARTIFDNQRLVDPKIPAATAVKKRNAKKKRTRSPLANAKGIESRDAYANWLTGRDNPRFAIVIANRLWKRAMGLGLIEPVDMIDDSTVASNPELLQFLAESMVEINFDMKEFLRAIYYSQTYQAQSEALDIGDPLEFGFPGPVMRRLTAEQIWDSLLGLTVNNIDQRQMTTAPKDLQYFGRDIYESFEKLENLTDAEAIDIMNALVEKGRRGLRTLSSQFQMEEREYRSDLSQKLKDVKKQIKQATRMRNESALRQLVALRTELTSELLTAKSSSGLLRSSELSSPAPAGHLLREFGQSDREEVENANTEPSVPQVLALMNGYIERKVIQNPNTVLIKNVVWQTSNEDKIKAIFLTVLSRLPTKEEKIVWMLDVKNSKTGLPRDLIWTLVNSNEFLFNK